MLPTKVRVLRIIIGVQVYRLLGLSLLLYSATLPSAFLIPTVVGDFLTGVLAPVVAFGVSKRRGPRTWAAALVWNVLGMIDLLYALSLGQLTNAGSVVLSTDPVVVGGAILGIILHIISISLLLQRKTIDYLLGHT
jgi:hypothetical protein